MAQNHAVRVSFTRSYAPTQAGGLVVDRLCSNGVHSIHPSSTWVNATFMPETQAAKLRNCNAVKFPLLLFMCTCAFEFFGYFFTLHIANSKSLTQDRPVER